MGLTDYSEANREFIVLLPLVTMLLVTVTITIRLPDHKRSIRAQACTRCGDRVCEGSSSDGGN